MKRLTIVLACVVSLAACASTPVAPSPQLAMYRAHAGPSVPSFRYLGRLDSWESLGDRTIAVWTRPHEAWLLDLSGPCNGLDFTPVIGLTSQVGQVSAGFDKVLVKDPANFGVPCLIQTIRPLDVKAIESEERQRRAAQAPSPPTGH